jgi:lysophospholipase L1-like esterase
MRRLVAVAATFVISLVGVATVEAKTAPPPPPTLLVLGDSLTWGTNYRGFGNVTPKLKAVGYFNTLVVDGVFARNISGPAGTARNGVKTLKKLSATGLRPDAAIIALGSNDLQHSGDKAFYVARIREMLALVGDIPIVWFNVWRTDAKYYPKRSATFNAALVEVASERSNVVVADWASIVLANPKLMAFDGLHLQPVGYRLRAQMYVEAAQMLIDTLSPPPTTTVPATTVPETTVPETTTTVAG